MSDATYVVGLAGSLRNQSYTRVSIGRAVEVERRSELRRS
jgi:hypothetical protein